VDFEDVNKKARRWFAEDELGVFIARQDGRDKAGTYSMRAVEQKSRAPLAVAP
jgi:hypothetical protein